MSDFVDYAAEIKSRVDIEDVISRYWEEPNYNHRVRCFIHNGKDKNMGINKSKNNVHCFVCGESRDVIGVVMELFNLDFKDACKKLDEDYNLGLEIGKPLTPEQKEELAFEQKHRLIHQLLKKIRKHQEREVFSFIADKLHETEAWMFKIKPTRRTDSDEQYDLYFEALKEVNKLDWFLDVLMGTERADECEFDFIYGTDSKTLYDKLIAGEIQL